jgi:hypothetical protein
MLRSCAALLAMALTLWLVPSAARACSCLPPPPPDEALGNASAVFEGRAANVVDEGMQRRFAFDVSRVWKGDVGAKAEVVTASSSAACGRGYAMGEVYVVYAYRGQDGGLADGLCTRTRERSHAAEDLAALGPGHEPGGSTKPVADGDPTLEPPRIDAPVTDSAPPPSEPSRRGCAVENAHMLDDAALLLLVGAGIAIRRRRIVRSVSRSHT